jgi:hypothetical protein
MAFLKTIRPIRPKPLMPTFVGLMIAMAEEFLDGRNMALSNCPPAEIANVVGCSEPSVFAIQSYLRQVAQLAKLWSVINEIYAPIFAASAESLGSNSTFGVYQLRQVLNLLLSWMWRTRHHSSHCWPLCLRL